MLNGSVLTTGQVADLVQVAHRTVAKWIDSGQLKGYRIPGSNDRRVTRANLLVFLESNRMPIPLKLSSLKRILLVGPGSDALFQHLENANWTVRYARALFVAGIEAVEFAPSVIVVDADLNFAEAETIRDASKASVLLYGEHERWTGNSISRAAAAKDIVAAVEQAASERE